MKIIEFTLGPTGLREAAKALAAGTVAGMWSWHVAFGFWMSFMAGMAMWMVFLWQERDDGKMPF